MFRIVPDYVQKGLMVNNVKTKDGKKLLVPSRPLRVESTQPEDFGGATGTGTTLGGNEEEADDEEEATANILGLGAIGPGLPAKRLKRFGK